MDAHTEAQAVARYIPSSVPEIKVEPSDPIVDINCQNFQDLSQGSNYRFQLLSSQSSRVESSTFQAQRVPNYQVDEFQNQMPTQNPANLQKKSNRQNILTQDPAKTSKNPEKLSPPFRQLISMIVPQLGKDKSLQLRSLCIKLERNEVSKEEFLPLMKEIVGEQIIKMTLYQLRTRPAVQLLQSWTASIEEPVTASKNLGQVAEAQIPYSAPQIKVESSDPVADSNGKIYQANKSQGIDYRSQKLTNLSHRGPVHQVTKSQYRVTTQSSGNLEQTTNRQLAEAHADMSRHVPSSVREVKVTSSDRIAGMNCQDSQGVQNLPFQSQRVQSFPIQSQRAPNYQCSESQNLTANQNPATLQQEVHQQTITTENPTNNLEEHIISYEQLFSMIVPQLDMVKTLQLQNLFIKLMRDEISKQRFLRLMKEIVGEPIIKMVLYQLETQAEGQADVSHHIPSSAREVKVESSDPVAEIKCKNSQAHLSRGLHNVAIQSRRVQNSPSQSQRIPNYQISKSQNPIANQNLANFQQTYQQDTISTQHTTNKSQKPKKVSFEKLIPLIVPQLDMAKAMQLQTLYTIFRRNGVSKEKFLRLMKDIVGSSTIEMAFYQLQTQAKVEGGSSKLPHLSSQSCRKPITSKQKMSTRIVANKSNKNEQLNVGQLIPILIPKLEKDKDMQLQILWDSLRNEVSNERFVSLMKEIVGEQKMKMALNKLHTQAAQNLQIGTSYRCY